MPSLESVPWFAVAPYSVVLDSSGAPQSVRHVSAGLLTLIDGRVFRIDPTAHASVLVPTFDDALGILAYAFPGLEIIE